MGHVQLLSELGRPDLHLQAAIINEGEAGAQDVTSGSRQEDGDERGRSPRPQGR